MKTILTTLTVAAFLATPAAACGWKKANKEVTASLEATEPKVEEAITTFDPATTPVFETEADAEAVVDETVEEATE